MKTTLEITPQTTLQEAIAILKKVPPHLQNWNQWIKTVADYAQNHKPPSHLSANLNETSLQQLMKLQTAINTMEDIYKHAPFILLGSSAKKMLNYSAFDVTAFVLYVSEEMNRIASLFNELNAYAISDSRINRKKATTKVGLFALVDWYARRMGFTCHEQASQTPWVIVYQCLKLDMEYAKE